MDSLFLLQFACFIFMLINASIVDQRIFAEDWRRSAI